MKRSWLIKITLISLIIWFAFGLRLYQLDQQSVWWDEGHSIFVASQAIVDIPTLPAMDVHPPAYFILLHGWLMVAGKHVFALRYLSLIFSLLTIALLWRFAQLIFLRQSKSLDLFCYVPSILTTLLATISPMYIAYAQEVRSYAMLTCLALGSTLMLWLIIRISTFTLSHWVGYVVLTTACLYTHYFTIFLLFFQTLIWLMWGFRPLVFNEGLGLKNRLLGWLAGQAAIILLFLPQLRLASRQITDYANPNLLPPTLTYFLSQSWQAYTVGLTIQPDTAWLMMLALAVVLLIAWALLCLHQQFDALFLGTWWGIPLLAYFVVLQERPSFEPRYLMLITPAFFLTLGLGLSIPFNNFRIRQATPMNAKKKQKKHGIILYGFADASLIKQGIAGFSIGLLLLTFLVSLHRYYTDVTFFKDDAAGVTAWLAQETTTNDIVYVDVPHPFHYYAEYILAPTDYLFVDVHTAADRLNQEALGRDHLYWVTWYGSDTDPRGIINVLAEKQGRYLGQKDFRGYQVQWFSLSNEPFGISHNLVSIEAIFGDVFRLDGADYGLTHTEHALWVTLHFSLLRDTTVDYKVSLRLRAADGQLMAQTDRDLLNDRHFRTAAWPVDDSALNQAINVYLLSLPTEMPSGVYQLEVVLYNAEPPHPSEGVTGSQASPDNLVAIIGMMRR